MMTFTLGSLTVYGYGLAVAVSAVLALLLAISTMKKNGLRSGTWSWVAVLGVPLCVLGARLMYVLCCWSQFTQQGLIHALYLSEGGFMLYGAVLGGLLAALLTAKATGQSFGKVADALSAPAALMIGLCRLAEGLAGQGYGWYVTDWFDPDMGMSLFHPEDVSAWLRFPFAVPDMYEEWAWAVFVVEAAIALVICVVLLRVKTKRPGSRTLLMLLLYAAMQAVCESMRQDAVLRWGFVRISQIFSAIAVAAVLLICCMRVGWKPVKRVVTTWVGVLCGMLLVIAMEFAVEKKIVFLEWLPVDCCYLIMFLAALLLIFSVLPIWHRADDGQGAALTTRLRDTTP